MVKLPYLLSLILVLGFVPAAGAQEDARLSLSFGPDSELVFAIQPAFHLKYGCLYPLTYQIEIPEGSAGLTVERRHSSLAEWMTLPEKTSANLFNGIEAVRFDYPGNRAHVSAAFAGDSDSLFIRIRDFAGESLSVRFKEIDKYYDDRQAVVTVSADDWDDTQDWGFTSALDVFRSYGLYVTCGIITGPQWCSAPTWASIQREVDLGYAELASHSRSHVSTPYADPASEVAGSADDIVSHVQLPAMYSFNGVQYVYTWIAPFGSYDATVDSLLALRGYLIPRLYNYAGQASFGVWNPERGHFVPIQPTVEIGAPPWGGGSRDTAYMNGTFDAIVASQGIYHLMWHPQGIVPELYEPYVDGHLAHISGRTDLWYSCLGPVYLYHLIEQANHYLGSVLAVPGEGSRGLRLGQNYPNPFGPQTTIGFEVAQRAVVTLRIFDVQGHRVATLVDGPREPGRYVVSWNAKKARSGTYFCQLVAAPTEGGGGMITSTRKMLLVR